MEPYERAQIEIIMLDPADVITNSSDIETPEVPVP